MPMPNHIKECRYIKVDVASRYVIAMESGKCVIESKAIRPNCGRRT